MNIIEVEMTYPCGHRTLIMSPSPADPNGFLRSCVIPIRDPKTGKSIYRATEGSMMCPACRKVPHGKRS